MTITTAAVDAGAKALEPWMPEPDISHAERTRPARDVLEAAAPLMQTPATVRWRVLYTASRLVTDWETVWADLDVILAAHPCLLLRTGHCGKGGDLFALEWWQQRRAEGRDVIYDPRPAPWNRLGKIAGPMRNGMMVGLGADECLAHIHPGSKTRGAAGCADFAEWAGIPVTRHPVT